MICYANFVCLKGDRKRSVCYTIAYLNRIKLIDDHKSDVI
jgi:hypothetical protein